LKTKPAVKECEVSGLRSGLPPNGEMVCRNGCVTSSGMPSAVQLTSALEPGVARGLLSSLITHGSARAGKLAASPRYRSPTLGARNEVEKVERSSRSAYGRYSMPTLPFFDLPKVS
jgi:hypothetical protein